MTGEEKQKAIHALKMSIPIWGVTQEEFKDYNQIMHKIMNWLEQEPYNDAVSRRSINKLQKYRYNCGDTTITCVSLNSINELPPVMSDERTLVRVNNGTPKEKETVIASTKYAVYPEARYTKEKGWEWAYESVTDHWVKLEDAEAWIPLPERYNAESEK